MQTAILSMVLATLIGATAAPAAEPQVTPPKGRTADQQERDQFDCHQAAQKETGVDPVALAEQKLGGATPAARKEGGGAERGALLGALRGGMDGDAGAGAARGAGMGRMIEVLRAKRQLREQQSTATSDGAAVHAQLDAYDHAYAACLTARGYTVK